MLNISNILAKDLQANVFNIYPFIIIETNDGMEDIFISQNPEEFEGNVYEDHNLKISNIKQSIDLESKKFKIGNISITLSNYKNFSDILSTVDLTNTVVKVYFKSPSCNTLSDCLFVYQANIRRLNHTEKTISIQLEDKTQEKISKDIPLANLGNSAHVYSDKYKNRYIPITYGEHLYAPAVIWSYGFGDVEEGDKFAVICDDVHNITGLEFREENNGNSKVRSSIYDQGDMTLSPYSNSLRAFKGEYVRIYGNKTYSMIGNPSGLSTEEGGETNYEVKSNFPDEVKCYLNKFNGTRPKNYFSADEFQGEFWRIPSGAKVIEEDNKNAAGITDNDHDWYDYGPLHDPDNIAGELTLDNPESMFWDPEEVTYDIFGNSLVDSFCSFPDHDYENALDNPTAMEDFKIEVENWFLTHGSSYWNGKEVFRTTYQRQNHNGYWYDVGADILDGMSNVSGDSTWTRVRGCSFIGLNENGDESSSTPYIWFNYAGNLNTDLPEDAIDNMSNNNLELYNYGSESPRPVDWIGRDRGNSKYFNNDWYDSSNPTLYLWEQFEENDYFIPKIGYTIYRTQNGNEKAGILNWRHQPAMPRIKFAHLQNRFAIIQIPDAKKIMKRLNDLGLVYASSYFTENSGDNVNNWSNYIGYTDHYMGRALNVSTSYAGIEANNDEEPIPFYGFFTNNYFQYAPQNYSSFGSFYASGYINEGTDGRGIWDTRNGDSVNFPAIQNESFWDKIKCQPHLHKCSLDSHGNIIWVFGIRNYTTEHNHLYRYTSPGDNSNIDNFYSDGYHDQTKFISVSWNPDNWAVSWHAAKDEEDMETGRPMSFNFDEEDYTTFATNNMRIGKQHFTDHIRWGSDALPLGRPEYNGNGNIQSIVTSKAGHFALGELFDMREMPVYIPYELNHLGSNAHSPNVIAPSYDCYWNGVFPDDEGNLGTGEGLPSFTNTSDAHNGGIGRWYTVSLKDMPNYANMSYVQSCFGLSYKADSLEDPYEEGWTYDESKIQCGEIRFVPGIIDTEADTGYLTLKAGAPGAKGKRIGIQFDYPSISLQDSIQDAGRTYWHRKIMGRVKGDENVNTNNPVLGGNYLEFYGGAVLNNEEDPSDFVGTSTALFKETYEFMMHNQSDPDSWRDFFLQSTGGGDPRELFRRWDNSIQPTSGGGNYWFSAYFDGTIPDDHVDGASNKYIPWYNPSDFDSVTMHFMCSKDSGVAAQNLSIKLDIYASALRHKQDFSNLRESDFYVKTKGRGYYSNGSYTTHTNPSDIIKDLCISELNIDEDTELNGAELSKAKTSHNGWSLAFSVPNKINSKNLIEELCSNTKMFPRIDSQNALGLIPIEMSYSLNSIYPTIKSSKILKYKFSRTNVEDVKSKVRVKFDMDYARGNLKKITPWGSAKDYLGDGDLGWRMPAEEVYQGFSDELGYRCSHFNLSPDESESELVFEAKYIRDMSTAEQLQKFLIMWNCQQHTIIDVDLTLEYINIEVGDIVQFDSLIGNIKSYGEDYTKAAYRNGQLIYPIFLVQAVSKNVKKVSVNLIQLHDMDKSWTIYTGDINRDGSIDINDLTLASKYISTKNDTFTKNQLINMDINSDKKITQKDLDPQLWIEIFTSDS